MDTDNTRSNTRLTVYSNLHGIAHMKNCFVIVIRDLDSIIYFHHAASKLRFTREIFPLYPWNQNPR
jgi:hypothetical protein